MGGLRVLAQPSELSVEVMAPDDVDCVTNPSAPGVRVRPSRLRIYAYPRADGDAWIVRTVTVSGPKVYDSKRMTKRDYSVSFIFLRDEDSLIPQWIQEEVQVWLKRLNG